MTITRKNLINPQGQGDHYMNLQDTHDRFLSKLNRIFFIVLLLCFVTPFALGRIYSDRIEWLSGLGMLFISATILCAFLVPAFMLGIIKTVKFEQSASLSIKVIKDSLGYTFLCALGFLLLNFVVDKGAGYLFDLYIENVNLSDLLYFIYIYHVFWIYLFVISRD